MSKDLLFIGIHNGHNSSAAVLKNSKIEFATQEERYTRVKNQGGLPLKTLKFLVIVN